VAVWRESMRVVPTLGLRSIAAAVAMLDDLTIVAVISRRHQAAKRVAPRVVEFCLSGISVFGSPTVLFAASAVLNLLVVP
jgi:hypothetical protein